MRDESPVVIRAALGHVSVDWMNKRFGECADRSILVETMGGDLWQMREGRWHICKEGDTCDTYREYGQLIESGRIPYFGRDVYDLETMAWIETVYDS